MTERVVVTLIVFSSNGVKDRSPHGLFGHRKILMVVRVFMRELLGLIIVVVEPVCHKAGMARS